MLARLRPRLNHATVVAYLALFVALGGTAWAVAANSVGTAELKDNAVTTPKIKGGAVTSPKLANGAVGSVKLGGGAVTNAKIANGAVSAGKIGVGQVNAFHLLGGTAAANLKVTVQRAQVTIPAYIGGPSGEASKTASCPAGSKAIAGGGITTSSGAFMEDSRPTIGDSTEPSNGQSFNGWRVSWRNDEAADSTARVYVVCVH